MMYETPHIKFPKHNPEALKISIFFKKCTLNETLYQLKQLMSGEPTSTHLIKSLEGALGKQLVNVKDYQF